MTDIKHFQDCIDTSEKIVGLLNQPSMTEGELEVSWGILNAIQETAERVLTSPDDWDTRARFLGIVYELRDRVRDRM